MKQAGLPIPSKGDKYREAKLPPVEACAVCKRRPADGHDETCPHRTEARPVVRSTMTLAEWAEQERRRRNPPPPDPEPDPEPEPEDEPAPRTCPQCGEVINGRRQYCRPLCRQRAMSRRAAAKQRQEETMPAATIEEARAAIGLDPQPDTHRCKKCDRPDGEVEFTQRKYGADAYCKGCRRDLLLAGRQKAAPAAEPEVIEVDGTPYQVVARVTPGDRPATAAELRAERERLVAYLEDLDARIEEAEALELLDGKTPVELQQLLTEAQRMVAVVQRAMAMRGAA